MKVFQSQVEKHNYKFTSFINSSMKKTNLKIGVSSCLLGNEVRYDGKHKQMRYITDILSNYFILIPVCPEVEIGMTVPREPVWLIDNPKSPQMVSVKTNKN